MPAKKPGVPKQPKPAKHARVTIGDSNADFQGRTNIQKALRTTAPSSPKFNATIKATLDKWSADTDQAVTMYNDIINKEAALEQAYGAIGTVLLQIGLDREAFITAVQSVCVDDADAKAFGCNQVVRGKAVQPGAPTSIRQILTDIAGTNKVRWPSVAGAASYMAQVSVDPPTATSYATYYTGKSPFFAYTGQPGQKLWIKLCSVGKAASAWSEAFSVVLR
jgi:hypothetical protein